MGEAFDAACRDLGETGQPKLVREIIAKRIIEAAKNGERDSERLCNAGLAALGLDRKIDHRLPGVPMRTNRGVSRHTQSTSRQFSFQFETAILVTNQCPTTTQPRHHPPNLPKSVT